MNTFSIFLGDKKTIFLKAVNETLDGDPLDLTNCTEIDIALPLADGTFHHLKLSEGHVTVTAPSVLGKFSAAITSVVSALLNPGVFQNLIVVFTINNEIFTVSYFEAFSVYQATSYPAA